MANRLPSTEKIRSALAETGFAVFPVGASFGEAEMLGVGASLGTPKPSIRGPWVVERLAATDTSEAHPNSLSSRYGLGDFPLHTDDVVSAYPAKYLLLFNAEGAANAETTVLDTRAATERLALERGDELREAVFLVQRGVNSFTSPLIDPEHGFLRFDPNVVRPTGPRSRRLLDDFRREIQDRPVERIPWDGPTLLAVDNHRCLHGRGPVTGSQRTPRVLLRVLVKEVTA